MISKFTEKMNSRAIVSRFGGGLVYFVDSIGDYKETEKMVLELGYYAYSDGINLVDIKSNVEDDCSNMVGIMKDGDAYNMQDFYSDLGWFDKSKTQAELLKTLNMFQTRKKYLKDRK